MGAPRVTRKPSLMHDSTSLQPPALLRGVTLTTSEYEELVRDLDLQRASHRVGLAQGFREARAGGSPGDGDEWLSALEDATVDQGRIAQLERLLAGATVVEDPPGLHDTARVGALVQVRDQRGRTIDYELVGMRSRHAGANHVSLGSPVGTALLGARPGEIVTVSLPGGRERVLTVLDVLPPAAATA